MEDDKNVPPVLLPLVTPDVKNESKHDMKILKELSDELPHIESLFIYLFLNHYFLSK